MSFGAPNNPSSSGKNRVSGMSIGTKLHIPPTKAGMLPRTHLVDRLSEGRDRRLVIISGVAGSGKTSLAGQWINRDNLRVVWYSLDAADNDTDLFFRYLITAFEDIDDRLAAAMEAFREQPRISGQAVIRLLIEHLAGVDEDIYLLLDDYHLIASQEIHDAISYFLDHMPPKMHMIILSRHALPFPVSRFRIRNQLMEISAPDMRFTDEEIEQFFSEIMPVKLSADEVLELSRYTEGWVGGLQLFGLSLRGKEILNDFSEILNRACHETTEYLIDEVIQIQPERIKSFLRTTVLLDRFNVDLCREITGLSDAPEILDDLYRKNLFLVPLDTEHTWYRFHQLFSEAISKGVKLSSPATYKEVQKKAALWFAKNGYLEDAFRHAFFSEDYEFAADLLEDYTGVLQERNEFASILRWFAKVPQDIYLQRTLLRLHECGLRMQSFQLLDIEATLRDIGDRGPQAFDRYEGFKRNLCEDSFTYLTSVLRHYSSDPANADVSHLNEAIQKLSTDNKRLSGYIKIVVALSHLCQGNPVLASQALKEASTTIFSSTSMWARMLWYRHSAAVERIQGHLRRSEAILREAFALLERRGLSDSSLKYLLYLPMAWVYYQHNELEKALEYAMSSVRYSEHALFTKGTIEGNLLLARIYMTGGEMEKSTQCMEKMLRAQNEIDAPNVRVSAGPCMARLCMSQGDLTWAEQWAAQRRLSMEEPFSRLFVHECMTLATLLHRQGRYDELVRVLELLRSRCVDRNMLEAVLEIDLLHSATLYELRDPEGAARIMEGAIVFAETEGYIRPFVDFAAIISPVLCDKTRISAYSRNSLHMANILAVCTPDTAGEVVPSPVTLSSRNRSTYLSLRELEILRLLAAGHQYKEIASKASISLNTVRAHVKQIFRKLEVNTRMQAIRRAQELRLLEKT